MTEHACETILDGPKPRSLGLRRIYVDGVMIRWTLQLFANHFKWRYQLCAFCCHPELESAKENPHYNSLRSGNRLGPFTWLAHCYNLKRSTSSGIGSTGPLLDDLLKTRGGENRQERLDAWELPWIDPCRVLCGWE